MKRLIAFAVLLLAGAWFSTSHQARASEPCTAPQPPRASCCRLPLGVWTHSPWLTYAFPEVCQPMFAAGLPLESEPPLPLTVVRLGPLPPTGKPPETPPQRPITDPPPRPVRQRIEVPFDPNTGPRPPIPAADGAKIHLLFLVDNEAKDAGKAHATGADMMAQLFKSGIRAERIGAVVRLNSADLNIDTISRKLNDVPVKPEDALVVYYAGAAEYDEAALGWQLKPSAALNKFPREELKRQVVARGARLTLLLSDPANHPAVAEPAAKVEAPNPGTSGLERLFFGTRGIADVHACSPGEFAAARGNRGGCFTTAFVREFGRPAGSWADLLESVKFSTNNLYKSYRLEVLKADGIPAPAKAQYRNQESQVPAPLTPVDNIKQITPGAVVPPVGESASTTVTENRLPAQLHLRVPAEATLIINGTPLALTGEERLHVTADLPTNQSHTVEIRMQVNAWVGVYQLEVTGGQTMKVELQLPTTVVAK